MVRGGVLVYQCLCSHCNSVRRYLAIVLFSGVSAEISLPEAKWRADSLN